MSINFLNSKNTITSFLFVSLGIFSNIDIGTDYLRSIGNIRFTIGAILELIKHIPKNNSFFAKLEYIDINGNEVIIDNEFVFFLASNLSFTSPTSFTSPKSKPDDGYIYLSYLTVPVNSLTLFNILLGLEDGSYINYLNYVKTKKFKIDPYNTSYNTVPILDIDGEEYGLQPFEVEIQPKSLKICY